MTKGDHVVATRMLWCPWPMAGVPKGTHGVVQDVSSFGTVTVNFGNGQVFDVGDEEVRREWDSAVRRESPWREPVLRPPPWPLPERQRSEEGTPAGDAMVTLFTVVMMMLLVVLGLILITDGVGYLTGHGQQRVVHIEETHMAAVIVWKTEPGPDYSVESVPEVETITIGGGYYLDSSGNRNSISLRGDDLKPGMAVQTRHPLLASGLVPELRSGRDGAVLIVGGVLCAVCVASEIALGSSSVSRARFLVGSFGIAQAFLVLWMLH
jgi:hypothetical protein